MYISHSPLNSIRHLLIEKLCTNSLFLNSPLRINIFIWHVSLSYLDKLIIVWGRRETRIRIVTRFVFNDDILALSQYGCCSTDNILPPEV